MLWCSVIFLPGSFVDIFSIFVVFMHHMRTTVDMPDHLLRRSKAAAALSGKSFKAFIMQALEHELESGQETKLRRSRASLPLIRSRHPGTLNITAETVAQALSNEDAHELAGH